MLQVLQPKTPLVNLSREDTSTIAGAFVGSYWERIRHLSGGTVSVGGIHCRALLDTGAGSSYVSAALLEYMGKQPVRREFKRIEMMMQVSNREIEIYNVVISSLTGEFQL